MERIYKLRSIFAYSFVALAMMIGISSTAFSQSWVAENQQAGFILKKVVSDTTVASGQSFSYTVYFTIPAGATNVTISDQIPASLTFLSHSFTSACGAPTVVAPAISAMGGTYSLSWASVPTGCTGSFTVTVAFPNGITCPGATVRNNVCLQGMLLGKNYDFCTPYVSTKATAVNPWGINKYPLGTAWQGGSCPYASGSDTITYQVCVYKSVGTTGQMNLVSGVVRDTLPAGAQLVSSTCGATQTGNVITWNVGSMSALPAYNTVCCQFSIYYPSASFPAGTNITNSATLSGQLGSPNQPCGTFDLTSNKPCVQIVSLTSGSINKWVYTNRQPGCGGKYLIYVCNTGTNPITVSALDTVPSSLSGVAIGSVWGLSATLSGNIVSINGTLAPGACGYVYVDFTIPLSATVGSTITNCATLNITGMSPQVQCASFVVDAPAAKPCLWKEVCNKQTDYAPGSTLRYRLRVQNTGGLTITGATITDVLDPNLEYVGNPSYYSSTAWNTPCTSTPATPWSGVSLSYNAGTNTVSATLGNIPATCQDIFYTSCGMYGTWGVPFYFIEFDVKVRDTAALGNVPNKFSLSGGSLGSSPYISNTEYVLVSGVVGYNLDKGVKLPSSSTYSSSLSSTAGSVVNYRLKMNLSGTAALRHVTFADLLPRDNGTGDSKILQGCGTRGSQYDINYAGFIASSPSIFSTWSNPAVALANVNSWSPTGSPGAAFTIGCGTNGTWSSMPWTAGQKNIASYFGPTAIGLSGATVEFSANVAAAAKDQETSCNSFAASGWTKHLIQSSIPSFQLAGQLESAPVCVLVEASKACMELKKFDVLCAGVGADGNQQYTFDVSATSCTPAIVSISSPDGSFSPASFNFATSPWLLNTTFTHTSLNNPVKIYFNVLCNNVICRDSVMRDLPQCPPPNPNDCCANFVKDIGKASIQYNGNTGFVGMSVPMIAGPTSIKSFTATIVSAQLKTVCNFSTGAWTRIYGDITAGSLLAPPAVGPQLLSVFSREAKWGPGECIDWNKGTQLKLNMIFPPMSGSFKCRDTLMFSVRYSFTNCECVTCDTVVTYKVVRYKKWLPWDHASDLLNIGIIKKFMIPDNKPTGEKNGNGILSDETTQTNLTMNDANNGDFTIISPDQPENDVTIHSIEIHSDNVPLTELSHNNVAGDITTGIGYLNLDIARGESAIIKLKFDNASNLNSFPIYVRYSYTINNTEGSFQTEPIEYVAYVAGANADEMKIDLTTSPLNVRTYALYFASSNGYGKDISAISLKPSGSINVLAVGPVNSAGEETYILPRLLDDGSYIINSPAYGTSGIMNQSSIKPIFITLSNVDEMNGKLEFSTFDESFNVVSSGMVELSDPISSVETGEIEGLQHISIQSIVPNPANGNISVTYSADRTISGAKFSIVDLLGREVMTLPELSSTIEKGIHIQSLNIGHLPSGNYYITLQTNQTRISKPLSIVK